MDSHKLSQPTVGSSTRQTRTSFLTTQKGDAVGVNWTVPKADFTRFLGLQPPTPQERSGTAAISGGRVLELAFVDKFQKVGLRAAEHGPAYSKFYGASDHFLNQPNHASDTVAEVRDALGDSVEKNTTEKKGLAMGSAATQQYMQKMESMRKESREDNMRYLGMQYKFEELGKQDSTLSNLMKARHDAVTRTIRGAQ